MRQTDNTATDEGTNSDSVAADTDAGVLLKRGQVAKRARVSERTISNWQAQRIIPFVKISPRCVRYSWPAVQRALDKLTVKEVE